MSYPPPIITTLCENREGRISNVPRRKEQQRILPSRISAKNMVFQRAPSVAAEAYQARTPAMEDAFWKSALRMGAHGFPSKTGYVRGYGRNAVMRGGERISRPASRTLRQSWTCANAPGPIKDCSRKLRDIVVRYKIKAENMWNMDERRFTLQVGTDNRAKVITRNCRRPARATRDSTRDPPL